MKKPDRVLLLFNTPYPTPRGYDFKEEFADPDNMYTENDVYQALLANGYTVSLLGIHDDIRPLLEEVQEFQPDVIFNLADMFREKSQFDKHVAALLELLGVPYTGASPEELFICNDKALSKKILRFHRLRAARFHTFAPAGRIRRPRFVKLPAVVKPLTEEASRGISQASVVDNDEAFIERVKFIHEHMKTSAIAEEYIEGRELYVSIFGYKRLTVLPPREMIFGRMSEDEPRIATYKAKWDDRYRRRWGIKSVFAKELSEEIVETITQTCLRAYKALNLRSYARFDIRLTPTGRACIIEPNANPCLARIDEFAQSAEQMGISYEDLIRRIVEMALQRGSLSEKNPKTRRKRCAVSAVS